MSCNWTKTKRVEDKAANCYYTRAQIGYWIQMNNLNAAPLLWLVQINDQVEQKKKNRNYVAFGVPITYSLNESNKWSKWKIESHTIIHDFIVSDQTIK